MLHNGIKILNNRLCQVGTETPNLTQLNRDELLRTYEYIEIGNIAQFTDSSATQIA